MHGKRSEKLCILGEGKKCKVFGPPGLANGKSISNLEETGVGVNFFIFKKLRLFYAIV